MPVTHPGVSVPLPRRRVLGAPGLLGGLRRLGGLRGLAGTVLLVIAGGYLVRVLDPAALWAALEAVARSPVALAGALLLYAAAFGLRSWAWCRVLPALSAGQSWAALHVALLGNHVLPFRLGEVLRVTSVLRRTRLPTRPVVASTLVLRAADLVAVLGLAAVAAPRLLTERGGGWAWVAAAGLAGLAVVGTGWLARLRRSGLAVRLPGGAVALAASLAWLLEASVIWSAGTAAGLSLSYPEAVAVTAVTIAAQTVAVTPGGVGSYEAAATAALVALGAGPGPALACALVAHAAKTGYALVLGAVALAVPSPGYFGRFRLPPALPPRPTRGPTAPHAPVVAMIPAFNEEATVGQVVDRLPSVVCGRPVCCLVVDDGSTDRTAERAARAGATVLREPHNRGLGAAVRLGLAEAVTRWRPACVVYLDADGEYQPEDLARLAEPVLAGTADYVVGSRFRGADGRPCRPRLSWSARPSAPSRARMRPHRMLGNAVLTQWMRWMTRRGDLTDGQSGFRAFSPEAAADAEIGHDYNYAQVLTLDLLGKGYQYAEVPISYTVRTSGTSFIRLGRYLRRVLPAVHRQLNPSSPRAPRPHPLAVD